MSEQTAVMFTLFLLAHKSEVHWDKFGKKQMYNFYVPCHFQWISISVRWLSLLLTVFLPSKIKYNKNILHVWIVKRISQVKPLPAVAEQNGARVSLCLSKNAVFGNDNKFVKFLTDAGSWCLRFFFNRVCDLILI